MGDDSIVVPLPQYIPQLVGQAVVYKTMSQSRPGHWHYTFIQISEGLATAPLEAPAVKCTCEGYQNHSHCWHLDEAMAQFVKAMEG